MKNFNEFTEDMKVRQDPDIKDREGTQPAKYYAGDMSKATKQARARHFEKKKSGPAPGDKSAKTKPSKHTLKYKQMFGENKSDKAMMMKLTTKAMKAIPNSPDQKELIKQVNVYRKKLGMKPMKEENLNEKIEGLVKKAEKSGISYGILKRFMTEVWPLGKQVTDQALHHNNGHLPESIVLLLVVGPENQMQICGRKENDSVP